MKKVEAQAIALEKSRLIIEYITQILSDSEKVNARMDFGFAKIDSQKMCVLDIYVPRRNFERHLNLGITNEHVLVLYEQLLSDFLEVFLEHEAISLSKYYSLKSMQENFSGIDASNLLGSEININFNLYGHDFMNLINKFEESRSYSEERRNR